MIKTVLAVVVAAIAALLIYASTKPDQFEVKRSVTINVAPTKIFPLINDLKQFNSWNPFLAEEPTAKLTYEATTAGKGAAYRWEGEKSGAGQMQITESTEPSQVLIKLDFIKPMEGHNTVEFSLQPQNEATQVSWAMRGPMPYVSKLMTVFFDMDKMVGGRFEAGLAQLKALAEKK
jgi:uncharacterized protein YndB with AHSA1/START domain